MNIENLEKHKSTTTLIEAILFIESEGVRYDDLKRLTNTNKKELSLCLDALEERLSEGIRLIRTERLCYLTTSDAVQGDLKSIYREKPLQLSPATLETLAIIAYTQPVTKASIEQIRGVSCSYLLRKLLADEYIKRIGKKDVPGRPLLFGTTQKFLMRFALESLEELPPLEQKEVNFLSNSIKDEQKE